MIKSDLSEVQNITDIIKCAAENLSSAASNLCDLDYYTTVSGNYRAIELVRNLKSQSMQLAEIVINYASKLEKTGTEISETDEKLSIKVFNRFIQN